MTGAGELRWKVAFDQRLDVDDEYGNSQSEFVEQFAVAAKIEPKFGGEAVIAARLQSRQPVIIVVRQSNQTRLIKEDWRARDVRSGEIYAIRSIVDPDGKRQFVEILTQTGEAA